jgi:hypothetical protein
MARFGKPQSGDTANFSGTTCVTPNTKYRLPTTGLGFLRASVVDLGFGCVYLGPSAGGLSSYPAGGSAPIR